MEHLSTHSSKAVSNLSIKKPKFVKNRFTDLKIKINKKKENASEMTERSTFINNEKTKKMNLDKAKEMIDKDLDNDKLLIKIIDNHAIYDYLDDLFYKSGDFDLEKDEVVEDYGTENVKNFSETSKEFFKKFRKFNDHTRKGLLKQLTPSNGFIKASQEVMIVPNPIAFINKSGDHGAINLKYFF